jgi:hypothetical protein
MTPGTAGRGSLCGSPALFVTIPLGRRLKGRKAMFRQRNQHEEAQEKGSQEPDLGALDGPYDDVNAQPTWQEGAFKLLILELVYLGIPLLLLRLINKLLTRSS